MCMCIDIVQFILILFFKNVCTNNVYFILYFLNSENYSTSDIPARKFSSLMNLWLKIMRIGEILKIGNGTS